MHLKLAKHGRFCKQKQPTPYQTHDELKDNSSIEARMFYKFCVCVLQHSAEAPGRNEDQTSPLPGSIGRLAPGLAGAAGSPHCSLAPLRSFRRLSQTYRLWYADYCGQPITHQIPFVWMPKPRSRRKPYSCDSPVTMMEM